MGRSDDPFIRIVRLSLLYSLERWVSKGFVSAVTGTGTGTGTVILCVTFVLLFKDRVESS